MGRSEAGDSLIEVLLAMMVLAIASVSILLAFSTSISGTAEHRSLVTLDTVLRSTADEATTQLQNQTLDKWTNCTGAAAVSFDPSAVPPASPLPPYTIPAGYSASISLPTVAYWSGTAFSTGCTANAPQRITILASYQLLSKSITLVVDDPNPPVATVLPAAKLVFGPPPTNAVSGAPLSPAPAVTIDDAKGNPVTADLRPIQLTLTPTSGGLSSNCTGSPSNGVETFANCSIVTAGTGYTLTATDQSTSPLPQVTSASFSVAAGPASQLVWTTSPDSSTGGTPFATQPVVTAEDVFGNVAVADASQATLAVTAGSGATGAIVANCAQIETAGVFAFSKCSIATAGKGYTLTATDGTLTPATGSGFDVNPGPATQVVFTTSPSSSTGGTPFATQPVIAVQDFVGNTVVTDTSTVTVAVTSGTGAPGASLSGCAASKAVGVTTLSNCAIAKAGANYTLSATDGSLRAPPSTPFNVTVGSATQLVFTTSPGNSTGGTPFATQPLVAVEDAGGNLVSLDASTVLLAITAGTGTTGSTVASCSQTESLGVVTFSSCRVNAAGANYTATATDGALTSAASGPFTVSVGAATGVVVTTSPGNSRGGTAFTAQPTAKVADAGGNTVTTNTATVTLATSSGTGTLACSSGLAVAAVAGVATYTGCNITLGTPGAFTLSAKAAGLTAGSTGSFTVSALGTRLVFTPPPPAAKSGVVYSTPVVVTLEDAAGNTDTTTPASVAIYISSGTYAAASCSADPVTAINGVATFQGCSITLPSSTAQTYGLSATANGLTGVSSVTVSP